MAVEAGKVSGEKGGNQDERGGKQASKEYNQEKRIQRSRLCQIWKRCIEAEKSELMTVWGE